MSRAAAAMLATLLLAPWLTFAAPAAGQLGASAERSALMRLAEGAAEAIEKAGAEPPVALQIEGTSAELARGFATLLAAKLQERRLPAVVLSERAHARGAAPDAGGEETLELARHSQARTLARIRVELAREQLRLRGDVLGAWVNFWSGASATRPSTPAAALALSTPADALAVALAAQPPPAALRIEARAFAELPEWPGALLASDLDADDAIEIFVLDERALRVLDPAGAVRATHSLTPLSLSSTPCREPYGALALQATPLRLACFACARSEGELLALEGGLLRRTGRLEEARLGSGPSQLRARFIPGQTALDVAEGVVSVADHSGHRLSVLANGLLRLEVPERASLLLARGGTAATLADLDGDGTPELIAAAEGVRPEEEGIRVWRLQSLEEASGGAAIDLAKLPRAAELPIAAHRLMILAAADLDANGRDEVLAAEWRADGTAALWLMGGRAP